MYAYRPKFEKKKEKLLCWFLALLGVSLYFASQFPGVPVPGLIQIFGVGCLAGTIMVVSMCVLRRFEYVLEETEAGTTDFIITEIYSRRKTVVCRVSLSDVCSVFPLNSENEEQCKALKKQGKHYTYTSVLFDEKRYLVEMNTHGEHIFVCICADETLLKLLTNR